MVPRSSAVLIYTFYIFNYSLQNENDSKQILNHKYCYYNLKLLFYQIQNYGNNIQTYPQFL